MKKIKLNYFIIPLITILVALFGNYFTAQGVNGWYKELNRPEWTPSGAFIGAMWTFLYFLITTVVLIFWNKFKEVKNFKAIAGLFILNAILNATWSMLFFGFNLLFTSLIQIITLNLTIIALIVLLWPESKKLSIALIPYTGWVSVATALNYYIWILN
jgi:tryptophan-rich sensory protein